jgi:hypothetical protein
VKRKMGLANEKLQGKDSRSDVVVERIRLIVREKT